MKRVFIFGSIAKGNFDSNTSDIDLIVELDDLPPVERGEQIMALWSELEDLLLRKVDLITSLKIKNPYLKADIEKNKFLIYDRENQKIFV